VMLQLVLKETFSLYEKRFFWKFKGLHEYDTEKWGMSC
jgi:hypothetical protein